MKIVRSPAAALLLSAPLLAGCALRGPMDFSCGNQFFKPVPASAVVSDILPGGQRAETAESAAVQADKCQDSDYKTRSPFFDRLCALPAETAESATVAAVAKPAKPPPIDMVLLSGGGPWGPFGGAFLAQLHKDNRYDSPLLITGVSTGSIQALFVAAAPDRLEQRLAELNTAYNIRSQSDIVNSNGQLLALLTGSAAGTKPLRRKIEASLCKLGRPDLGCPGIEAISSYAPYGAALIGFVYADTGELIAADVVEMAKQAIAFTAAEATLTKVARNAAVESRRKALRCLTGAVMASSSVPVQLQQVRINGRTAMDGGVRASVFEAEAITAADLYARRKAGADLRISIVRNGPTTVLAGPDEAAKFNKPLSVLSTAQRAQSIIVNQTEITSVAQVRLSKPTAQIRLVTADGANLFDPTCVRPAGKMFPPQFMACLARYGSVRAKAKQPWKTIRTIQTESGTRNGQD
jgi:hypothetical protein